jgi:2-C-methyl-D-erythritol 2,4-cyclodiphosphate synthase
MRVGLGFDLHRLAVGRKLMLGGIEIPFEKGGAGHSDADVLIHAICDALLGAAGLGDIGELFPDTDPQWKDAASEVFLKDVLQRVQAKGLAPQQVDATVFAQEPKLGPHKPAIRENLARLLGLGPDVVNVKAKTMEGLAPIGSGDAIAAQAVAVLAD